MLSFLQNQIDKKERSVSTLREIKSISKNFLSFYSIDVTLTTASLRSESSFGMFYTWIHTCNATEQDNNYLSGGNNVLISL